MKVINYSKKEILDTTEVTQENKDNDMLFILCEPQDVLVLNTVFLFDESTVLDCTDLDESVRYSSFDGYDFISLVHIELTENGILLREINLYISSQYLVLVMPEHDSQRLRDMEEKLLQMAEVLEEQEARLNRLYFTIFHLLLTDFSDTLEILEDYMEELSDNIVNFVKTDQFISINQLRGMSYAAKKQLRALSYIGDQILLDENEVIEKRQMQYFRSISTRLKKLYDFSESLHSLSGEMLYTFDSRMAIKTNDTVNKLTVITLFFAPLTVITGIYGMNFHRMPELKWSFGYPMALLTMITVSLILYFVLKRKKWL